MTVFLLLRCVAGTFRNIQRRSTSPERAYPFQTTRFHAAPLSPVATNALTYLFPLPNANAPDALANNYVGEHSNDHFERSGRPPAWIRSSTQDDGCFALWHV